MGDAPILLGVIGRPHGVRGHVHVHSYTTVPEQLADYGVLTSGARRFTLRWVSAGVAAVSELVDGVAVPVADRGAAERLVRLELSVDRAALPAPDADEFYLADLIGLAAVDPAGVALGQVAAVHDYGAGASVEIAGPAPLIVPFTRACVPVVDVGAGRIVVCVPDELVAAEDALAAAPLAGVGA